MGGGGGTEMGSSQKGQEGELKFAPELVRRQLTAQLTLPCLTVVLAWSGGREACGRRKRSLSLEVKRPGASAIATNWTWGGGVDSVRGWGKAPQNPKTSNNAFI